MSRTAREWLGVSVISAAWGLAICLLGAAAGLAVGLSTATHVPIAGTDASVRIKVGQSYDRLEFTGLLTGKRAAGRALLGEPIGVDVQLDLDTATFLNANGAFDPRVLPAYIQIYSNPNQLGGDIERAVARHVLRWVLAGLVAAGCALVVEHGYRAWRHRQDTHLADGARLRDAALAYRAPERRIARRTVLVIALAAVLASLPSSDRIAPAPTAIEPTPLLDGTPLAGAEVGGPLLPAFDAAEAYIRKYFADTNTYYGQVRTALLDRLASDAPPLPDGADVVNVGFVTDRHCNTGMDRVIVTLLQKLDTSILVSSGDDAFSGTFGFESACTASLASATHRAHITDVFTGGNHDSPATLDAEKAQGIKVLEGNVVTVDGLRFTGRPDPRSSRYGQGLRPASPRLRDELVAEQGEQTGAVACRLGKPVIVVEHDSAAALRALQYGCGNAVLALSGHTHKQAGPLPVALPDTSTGYSFTGASTGGAPTDKTIEQSFASQLTVGPLRHDATINIASVDRTTGRLVAMTECHISPDETITFEQQLMAT